MKVGKMRYRVTLQKPSEDTDEFANPKDEWVDVSTIWADIVPVSGREYFAAQQNMSETQYKIYIRFLDGITPKMRMMAGNKFYEILTVLGDKQSGLLTLMVKEIL